MKQLTNRREVFNMQITANQPVMYSTNCMYSRSLEQISKENKTAAKYAKIRIRKVKLSKLAK